MDLAKIGEFIKELRKEKNITQEELADKFYVSRRTVSRWECGANLPDIDVLIDLADFFNVDLREILNGKRKEMENMNDELKETAKDVNDYSKIKFKRTRIITLIILIVGLISIMTYFIMIELDLKENFITGFVEGLMLGISTGALIVAILYITGVYDKLVGLKMKRK